MKDGGEEFLTTSQDVVTSLPSSDVNFLQAVSSLLNSAENAARGGGSDLTPRAARHSRRRNNSNSGGISSPTEVLVTPLQVASEEMASVAGSEELTAELAAESESIVAEGGGSMEEKLVENVLVVEVEPEDMPSMEGVMSAENMEVADLGVVITETAMAVPTKDVEEQMQQELGVEGVEQEVVEDVGEQ